MTLSMYLLLLRDSNFKNTVMGAIHCVMTQKYHKIYVRINISCFSNIHLLIEVMY